MLSEQAAGWPHSGSCLCWALLDPKSIRVALILTAILAVLLPLLFSRTYKFLSYPSSFCVRIAFPPLAILHSSTVVAFSTSVLVAGLLNAPSTIFTSATQLHAHALLVSTTTGYFLFFLTDRYPRCMLRNARKAQGSRTGLC